MTIIYPTAFLELKMKLAPQCNWRAREAPVISRNFHFFSKHREYSKKRYVCLLLVISLVLAQVSNRHNWDAMNQTRLGCCHPQDQNRPWRAFKLLYGPRRNNKEVYVWIYKSGIWTTRDCCQKTFDKIYKWDLNPGHAAWESKSLSTGRADPPSELNLI